MKISIGKSSSRETTSTLIPMILQVKERSMDLLLISMLAHPNLKKAWDIKISQM